MNIIRRSLPALLAVTTAFVLAGCGSGPSKVGAAAVVGDHTVSLDAVQEEIRWLIKNVPQVSELRAEGKLDLLSRHVVGSHIQHELLRRAAKDEGLKVDQRQVDQLIEQVGGEEQAPSQFYVSPSRVREFAEDYVLVQQLGQKYVDRISVDLVGALVADESPGSSSRQKALDLAKKIADDPARAAELANGAGGQPFDQTYVLREILMTDEAQLVATPLFSAKPGTVVVVQPNPQQGAVWLVALVENREISAAPEQPSGQPNASPQVLSSLGMQLLGRVADEVGVTVSPRYGVWDRAGVAVAEGPDQLAGHLLTARADRSK